MFLSDRSARTVFSVCCLVFEKSRCKLVGAGRRLKAALDALNALDDLIYRHAGSESRNALGVTVTSTLEYDLNDLLCFGVDGNVDCSGANALCLIGYVLDYDNIPLFLLLIYVLVKSLHRE